MRHDNNFNFLRFWLAWVVILSHSFELLDGNRSRELLTRLFGTYSFGEFAVNAFFLMSGYFIAQSWVSTPRLWPYMQKRLLRLVPGFSVAVLLSVLVVGPLGSAQYWEHFNHWRFWPQLLVLRFDSPYSFDGRPYPMINGPLWTLHYEYLCYWLVALIGGLGLLCRPRVILPLFGGLLLGYLGVLVLKQHGWQPRTQLWWWVWILGGHYVRLFCFFAAGMVWFLYRDRLAVNGAQALALAVGCALFMFHPLTAAVAMTLPLALLIHYLGYRPLPVLRVFQGADLSYGMYLYAWPIQKLLIHYDVARQPWPLVWWTTLFSVLAAWLSWHLIEKPFLRLKPRPLAAG